MRVVARLGLGLLALVLVLVLLVVLATAWAVRRPFPVTEGTLAVPGLDARVLVTRDAWGVPSVAATTSHDLFFAQGYVHAQDRFWEMDFRRHVTAGRLSELFGDTTLETDEFVRTMGWRRIAEQEVALLSPESLAHVQAYADGVNAYIGDRSPSDLSLEYSVLALTNRGYQVEPWTPADSLAWLKAMSFDLSGNASAETERTLLAARVGADRAAQLFPAYPYDRHRPILDQGSWTADGAAAVFDPDLPPPSLTAPGDPAAPEAAAALGAYARSSERVRELLGLTGFRGGAGSNNWVVSGELTASGRPLLANDPHLAPGMPSIWTQMGLHCVPVGPACPYDVAGFTFSGFPGVIIGHNADVAWGFTNLAPDTQDLFLERVQGDTVLVDDTFLPLTTREEVIEVAGADPVTITVRASSHGPLMSDVSDDYADVAAAGTVAAPVATGELAVALAWTALQPGRTAEAVFALNRATDWPSFLAAAELFETPSQNMVYADLEGHIGYATGGTFPVRRGFDGLTPAPGWDSSVGWDGTVPFAAVPKVLDPDDGFVVTANNQLTFPGLGYEFVVDNAFGARSQRITDQIEDRVDAGEKLTADVMRQIQNDTYDEGASYLVPLTDGLPLTGEAAATRALWIGWDYRMDAGSAQAAAYAAFYRALVNATFADEVGDLVTLDTTDRWVEVMRALPADDPWWDDTATPEVEDRSAQLARAVAIADEELRERLGADRTRWRWDALHTLEIRNPTFGESGIPPIEWLFNRGPYGTGGSGTAPNANDWNTQEGYEIVWIPSMRMVVDLADLDASTWVNLTGASGHAFAPNYVDQAPLWAEGSSTPFPFSRDAVLAAARQTLILNPA